LYVVPRHVCTTVALYDAALVEDGAIVDRWSIEARARPSLRTTFGRQEGV